MIYNQIREVEENLETEDKTLLEAIKAAAINYCIGYTGLEEEKLDDYEDVTIAVLTLISDMWDNRSMTVDRSNPNRAIDTILGMHSINLLPTEDEEVS